MAKFNTGSVTIDRLLQIKNADENFYKYVGLDSFASLAKSAYPKDLPRLSQAVAELAEDGHNVIAYRIRRQDGRYRWILADLEYNTVELNGEQLINVNIQDIQALERELSDINNTNLEYREFFGLLDEFLFVYNINEGDFKMFMGGNKQTVSLFSGTLQEFIEDIKSNHYVDKQYESEFDAVCEDIRRGTRSFRYELLSSKFSLNNTMDMHLIKGKTILDHSRERKVIGCVSVVNQHTKKKEINYFAEASKDAAMDVLNKKAITDYVTNLLASKPKEPIHLCILDLDNFKNINDTFGHMFGDEVLVTAANILKEAIGEKGIIGRIGGDEMMIVLEKIESHSELRGVLRSVRSNIEWAYKGKKENVDLTCSVGVASYPAHANNYEDLFKIADKMLYNAKKKGKNRYIIYTPEIHGDVLHGEIENNNKVVSQQKKDKEKMVLRILDFFLHKQIMTYETAFEEIALTMDLDEITIFYGDKHKAAMGWKKFPDEMRQSIEFVDKDNFQNAFNENGIAVINYAADVEMVYPAVYHYMKERNITSAIIYRMSNRHHEGYVAFYKRSMSARKWSNDDKAYLNFLGKAFELAMDDR